MALGGFWSCRRGVRQGSHHRQGDYDDGTSEQTLIEHWNGTAWKVEPTPNQGGSGDSNDLFGGAMG